MSSLFALLGTMGSALSAQEEGLNVTGQNVSNVNTPGYVEQQPVLETAGTGGDGGVTVASVQSTFDAFTFGQVLTQQGLSGAANSQSEALSEAQNVIAPQGGGDIGSQMTAFFSSLQALSANPSDPSARSAVLAQAANVAQSFSTTATGLAQQQESLLQQAQGVATQVNSDLQQIASLNGQIAANQAQGSSSSGLSDQLDSVVSDVANQVGGTVVQNSNGSMTLFAAGVALVSGNSASSMNVSVGSSGAMQVTVDQPGGAAPTDVTSNVTAGTLGGLREARDVDIAQSATQLDQLAYGFANAVNAVQSAGYGLDGVTGRPLFTPPTQVAGAAANMSVDPQVAGQPNAVAATANPQDLPGGNDNVIALEQIAEQSLGTGGTPSQQYAALTAQIGNAASAASSDATMRSDTLTQAQNLNSSASGVSLNEQTVNMTQFQQAFEAATQVLVVASNLLGEFFSDMSSTTG